jgi:lipopolysaccharide/colanic/teichoic acid biosynthesis glycosyltransferase
MWQLLEQRIAAMQLVDDTSIVGIKSNASEQLAPNRSVFHAAALLAKPAKRALDIFVAIAGLVVFSPTFLLVATAIRIETRGSVFSRQVARGFNNELIRPLRFRTTTEDVDDSEVTARRRQLTQVGRVLRSSGLEGLPQLINILRGDMSLVGPQLRAPSASQLVHEQLPKVPRHRVKSGIIGWAQVNGCGGAARCSSREIQQQIEHDLYYVENWSFLLDLKIVLMTLLSKATYQ